MPGSPLSSLSRGGGGGVVVKESGRGQKGRGSGVGHQDGGGVMVVPQEEILVGMRGEHFASAVMVSLSAK